MLIFLLRSAFHPSVQYHASYSSRFKAKVTMVVPANEPRTPGPQHLFIQTTNPLSRTIRGKGSVKNLFLISSLKSLASRFRAFRKEVRVGAPELLRDDEPDVSDGLLGRQEDRRELENRWGEQK